MNQKMKLLPKGIQSFSKLIEKNCVYVDKTELIYQLITQGDYYFLSHPRRFGKSLLLSTLAELFAGNKKLFKGLWIESSDYEWIEHPIINISFSSISHSSPQELQADMLWTLKDIAANYKVDISQAPSLQAKFKLLIQQLSSIQKVVILVDEYDYAILSNVNNVALAVECRNVLRDFFTVIKDSDRYIKFVFLTGVTKFAKTSLFSGLNNLEEISISSQYNTLLGYTQQELITYFEPHLQKVSQAQRCSMEQLLEKMRAWYDGYQFSKKEDATKVYNPYSVLLFLTNGDFDNYWFQTGTPTFLIELIKKRDFPLLTIDNIIASEQDLGAFDIESISIKTVLFQAGYLTIDYYDAQAENYHLKFPNLEVRASFLRYILNSYAKITFADINEFAVKLIQSLEKHNVDLFCRLLQTFFADIPASMHIPLERYYQTIFFVLAKILGLNSRVEVSTNIGRIDMVVELKQNVYIFEFKIRGTAQDAIDQIEDKQYYQKYMLHGKHILLTGILFDIKKRNLDSWITKEIHE